MAESKILLDPDVRSEHDRSESEYHFEKAYSIQFVAMQCATRGQRTVQPQIFIMGQHEPADGGDGGNGGNVYFYFVEDLTLSVDSDTLENSGGAGGEASAALV